MRRPSCFQRRHRTREVKKKYIVATEGECTERIYFEAFRDQNYRKNIFIQILATKDGNSSPEQVLARLQKFAREQAFDPNRDECWLVVDYDSWGDAKLDAVYAECEEYGYKLAVTNPCFELWLNFHQKNPKSPKRCSDCIAELQKLLGDYEKHNFDVGKLLPSIQHAIKTASHLDAEPTEPYPKQTGSRVYLLVEKLIAP
jgi:hypothetical protein